MENEGDRRVEQMQLSPASENHERRSPLPTDTAEYLQQVSDQVGGGARVVLATSLPNQTKEIEVTKTAAKHE